MPVKFKFYQQNKIRIYFTSKIFYQQNKHIQLENVWFALPAFPKIFFKFSKIFWVEGWASLNSSCKFTEWPFLKMHLQHIFLEEYVFFGMMNKIRNVWNFNINVVLFAYHISIFLEQCIIIQLYVIFGLHRHDTFLKIKES